MNSTQIFSLIRQISGLTVSAKIRNLQAYKDDEQLAKVFKLTLDKSITFGVTSKSLYTWPQDPESHNFNEGTWQLLEDLQNRRLTGEAAKQALYNAGKGLNLSSLELLKRILDRNLDCGVGAKTALKVWPDLFYLHQVMLAKKFDRARCEYPCLVEPKIDGTRATFTGDALLTRNGLPLRSCNHIITQLQNDSYGWADGELMVPGLDFFSQSDGLIRGYNQRPQAIYYVFALGQKQEHFMARSRRHKSPLPSEDKVQFVQGQIANNYKELMSIFEDYRAAGFEGAMVKQLHGNKLFYESKRSFEWMKLKPSNDAEFKCIGVYEGEGKYQGMLGGICIEHKGQENRVGTGFSDEERLNFWVDPTMIVGNEVTVEWMEETIDGNLRHSRFKGLRWDK